MFPCRRHVKRKGACIVAVRTVCTTHARHAAPAGRAVRRPPPHPYAMPGPAAHPVCKPRFVSRRPSRRLAFAGALMRLCVVAGSALLLLAALHFMAGDLAFLSLVPGVLPALQASGNGRAGLPLEVAPVLQNPELPNGCEAANAYLGAQGSPLRAASLSGAGTDKLLAGQPGCNAGLTQAEPLPLRSQREAVSCVPPMRRAILSARRTFLSRSVPFETFAFCFSFYS